MAMDKRAIDEFDKMAKEYQFLLPHIEQIYASYLLEFTPNQKPQLTRYEFFAKLLSEREDIKSTLDWWYKKAFDRSYEEYEHPEKVKETVSNLFFSLMEGILNCRQYESVYKNRILRWLHTAPGWFKFFVLKGEFVGLVETDRQLALYLHYLEKANFISVFNKRIEEAIYFFFDKEIKRDTVPNFSVHWNEINSVNKSELNKSEFLKKKGVKKDIELVTKLLDKINPIVKDLALRDL